jgi:hypothetical protein
MSLLHHILLQVQKGLSSEKDTILLIGHQLIGLTPDARTKQSS